MTVKMQVHRCFAKASISLVVSVELMQSYIEISSRGVTLKLVFLGDYQSLSDCPYFWLTLDRAERDDAKSSQLI